jgi:hypothetical protein
LYPPQEVQDDSGDDNNMTDDETAGPLHQVSPQIRMLLSEDTIAQWISSETQKRKKSSKKGPTEKELEQELRIREL